MKPQINTIANRLSLRAPQREALELLDRIFGWPPLWPIIAGQFVAKLVGGAAWSLLLRPRRAEVEVVCE